MKQKAYVRGDMDECPRCGAPLNDNAVCDACGWPSTAMAERRAFEAEFKASMKNAATDEEQKEYWGTFYEWIQVDWTLVDGIYRYVKPWYMETYPNDDMGADIDSNVSFSEVAYAIESGRDVYNVIGVGDSIIRERIFYELAGMAHIDYNTIYEVWLHPDYYSLAFNLMTKREVEDEARRWGVIARRHKNTGSRRKHAGITVRDFIKQYIDIDVVDDYCEDLYIAFCGPLELTAEGEKEWSDVLDLTVDIMRDIAVVHVEDDEYKCRRAAEFFNAVAGFCTASEWDRWFIY